MHVATWLILFEIAVGSFCSYQAVLVVCMRTMSSPTKHSLKYRLSLFSFILLLLPGLGRSQPAISSSVEDNVTQPMPDSNTEPPSTPYRPNILFIMMDDLGSADLGIHGSGIRTPVSDKLARNGVYLNEFYATPMCTTTRISFMTGRYPYRMGIFDPLGRSTTQGMPVEEETIAQVLQRAGYQPHAVGKWHVGHASWNMTPTFRGFMSFYGFYGSAGQDHFAHVDDNVYDMRWDRREFCGSNCSSIPDARGVYSSQLFAEQAANVIKSHEPSKGPLFLYLAFAAAHVPLQVPKKYLLAYQGKNRWSRPRQVYAGMITAADEAIGLVLKALGGKGLWKDTLVIFQSDNGGATYDCFRDDREKDCGIKAINKGRSSGKGDIWEGGVNCDGFLSGPALEKLQISAGRRSNILFHTVDWLPTLAAMTGVVPNGKVLDGVDQLDALRYGRQARLDLFVGYSNINNRKSGRKNRAAAVRQGDWKLIRDPQVMQDERGQTLKGRRRKHRYALFDLKSDKSENTDVSSQHRDIVAVLTKRLEEYEETFLHRIMPRDPACRKVGYNLTTWKQKAVTPWCM